jgi:hypothetical protein
LTSTRRSTRFSALEAIRAGSTSPPTSRLARAAARSVLPLTIGLGPKDLLARSRRAFLLVAAIALTDAVVVTALSLDATLDAQAAIKTSDFPDELLLVIYTLDTVLLLITVTTVRGERDSGPLWFLVPGLEPFSVERGSSATVRSIAIDSGG